jgi:hypothetical protein
LALEDQFREEDVAEIEAKHAEILDEHSTQQSAEEHARKRAFFDWDAADDLDDEMWGFGPIR